MFKSTFQRRDLKLGLQCSWLILLSTLAGCSFLPTTSPTIGSNPQVPVQLTGNITSSQNGYKVSALPAPEILTFPSLVPLQQMTPATSLPKGKVFDVTLTTDPTHLHRDEIVVPPNGAFKVIFQPGGNGIKIIDDDARDGLAVVTLGAGIYDGYIGTDVTGSSKLTVENNYYYQKQDIVPGGATPISQNGQKPALQVYKIGTRQLPVPTNWLSPDGQNFVLNFVNQGTNTTSIRWYSSSNPVPMPLGMKEIGPSGGSIELPNVGKVEIPAGALSQATIVRMSQPLQAASKEILHPNPNKPNITIPGIKFISPIVKIEPFLLKLNTPANLTIYVDKSKYQNVLSPYLLDIYGISNLMIPESYSFRPFLSGSRDDRFSDLDGPAKINWFVNYAKTTSALWHPSQNSFHIQQHKVCTSCSRLPCIV